ncbi:MAG: threonine synthase, partial [Trueperaceae bacterium]
ERFVVELFHGPTLSFKDFGARTMARLMDGYLAEEGQRLTILVATSGDTGSAVADGFAGLDNLRVVLLYPKGMVSDVQERQLTAARPGLRSLRVRGTFDDCQRIVKEAFVDPKLSGLPLSSANSINIGRLLPQQLYYIWAAAQLSRLRPNADAPVISVPSGNLGNLTAGMLAASAGLPVSRFLAAHNANDYFPRYLSKEASPFDFGGTVATISNAMDVGAPSNFERLHAMFGSDLPRQAWGVGIDDEATRRRMLTTFEEDDYIACPHTSVGLEAVERYRASTGDESPALILATAHPAKFPGIVREILGQHPPGSTRLDGLLELPSKVEELSPGHNALRDLLLAWD